MSPVSLLIPQRGAFFLWVTLFLFFHSPAYATSANEEAFETTPKPDPYVAWWTGSLLSAHGHVVPLNHIVVEPYVTFSTQYGSFSKEGFGVPNIEGGNYTASTFIMAVAGLTDRLDLQVLVKETYRNKRGTASTQFGDTSLRLAFQILEAKNGKWTPDFMFAVKQTFPTGRYDHLNPDLKGLDAGGSGAYATSFGFNAQKIYLMPNAHPLRMRLNMHFQSSPHVPITGFSSYNTGLGATGSAAPGNSLSTVLAGEYHLTQSWVFALDIVHAYQGRTAFMGYPGTLDGKRADAGSDPYHILLLAPAFEYNFNGNVGIIAGASIGVLGYKAGPATIEPMVAVNIFQ